MVVVWWFALDAKPSINFFIAYLIELGG